MDDINERILEKANLLSVDDLGKDLAAVQALQRKQEAIERDMTALQNQLEVSDWLWLWSHQCLLGCDGLRLWSCRCLLICWVVSGCSCGHTRGTASVSVGISELRKQFRSLLCLCDVSE